MRSYKILLAVLLLTILTLMAFTACSDNESGGDTSAPVGEGAGEPTVAPETDLVLAPVASASLGSTDAVEKIGVQAGDVIVEAAGCYAGGAVYRGENDQGRPIWGIGTAEPWPFSHEEQIPAGFPTVFVKADATVDVINNSGLDVVEEYYMDYLTGEIISVELPAEAGIYVRMITVEDPRPGLGDPRPALDAVFGEWYYFVVVVVE